MTVIAAGQIGQNDGAASLQRKERLRRWWLIVLIGVLTRFCLSGISIGTNDATTWLRFGNEIGHWGLIQTYERDPLFNHPPIPGYWAMIAARVAGRGASPLLFTNLFKLPMILADVGGIYLLWRIWHKRIGTHAMLVPALFAMSLDAILVSAFHCNTEPLYIALCLLAVYLIQEHEASFWGGMALGAAINVKIIPVLLIPVLILSSRRREDAVKLLLGLLPWVLPFLAPLLLAPHHFVENALQYNSSLNRWGVSFFLLLSEHGFQRTRRGPVDVYFVLAKFVVFALVVLWSIAATWLKRWNRYELAAMTLAIFLVFTSGFGVQYTALVGLLLFAIRPAMASAYGLAAGAFICSVYAFWWGNGARGQSLPPFSFPVQCWSGGMFPLPPALLGLIAWGILIWFMLLTLVRPVDAGGGRVP